MELVVALIAGVLGGNAAGAVLKPLNLGLLGNSLAGLVGGLIGGQVGGQLDPVDALNGQVSTGAASVIAVLALAAVGGFGLTILGGLLRQVAPRR